MTEREKIIYLAGITDGEGHFYYPATRNGRGELHHYPRLVIIQKDFELIRWLKANYGGCVTHGNNETGGYYRWQLQGKKVKELANLMLPYLIVKRGQVK